MLPCLTLSNIRYVSRVKWSNPGKEITVDIPSDQKTQPHTRKLWTWLKKRNLMKETESLLLSAQNNAIRTNYVKARIDKTK